MQYTQSEERELHNNLNQCSYLNYRIHNMWTIWQALEKKAWNIFLFFEFKIITIFYANDNGDFSKNSLCFCYLIQHIQEIQQNDTAFESGNAFLLMQCYVVWLIESQYVNLFFTFIIMPFIYWVPVNLLSLVRILLNSKRHSHTFYTLRLSLLKFFKTLQ